MSQLSNDIQVKPKPDEIPSNQAIINSASPRGNAPAVDESTHTPDDAENDPTINDVESLRKGVIKTSKNKAHTILLVGETGVGKSSVFELIANVLLGKDSDHYDFEILDHTNEQGGLDNQSSTNSARLYEFTSSNGVVVRILDTPGSADTRGIQQDELHKRSILTQIKENVDSISAVLVLANGTVPRGTGLPSTLSTLSAILPKTLANNIAFMFTNVLSPLSWNFSQDTIPEVLKGAPQFHLDNPVALQKRYLALKDSPNMTRTARADLRESVKAAEQSGLEMLVKLYDWLDGLEPQPTTGLFPLYEASQNITNPSTPMGQVCAKNAMWLPEHGSTDMEKRAVSRDQLESVQRSLGRMKRNLDLLERLWEVIRKVKQIFIRA